MPPASSGSAPAARSSSPARPWPRSVRFISRCRRPGRGSRSISPARSSRYPTVSTATSSYVLQAPTGTPRPNSTRSRTGPDAPAEARPPGQRILPALQSMGSRFRRRDGGVLVALAMLWCLGVGAPTAFAVEPVPAAAPEPGPVRNILLLHVIPRSTPALVAMEQTFMSTLKAQSSERLAFASEYVDLAMFDRTETFESELVAYLAAKYARTKLDLVTVTTSDGRRFTMRHRDRLFPGVPVVFISVVKRLVEDVPLDADVTGVWLTAGWTGTLAAARALQPDIERVIVITGASAVD